MTTVARALIPALALMPALALIGPSAAYAPDPFEPATTDDPGLIAAWQAWDDKGIDDYTTTVQLSCFCLDIPVVRTVVRDGEVVRVRQGGRRLGHGQGHSMDQLFLMIREAFESADRVEVTYTSRGVPKSIAIDPEKMAMDEETYYTVSLMRP